MNFSHYKGLVDAEKVHRFVFAQGNRPAVEGNDGSLTYLSETFLFDEDMASILTEIESSKDPSEPNIFFIDGGRYSFQKLSLKDSAQVYVYPENEVGLNWNELLIPGYVDDWIEAKSGVVVFYGSDVAFVEKVRLAFSKRRTEVVKGSSVLFTSSLSGSHVSNEGHFLSTSTDEAGFLNTETDFKFDFYSFNSDLNALGGSRVLRLADKGSFVLINSIWGDLSKVWAELYDAFDSESTRDFFFESVVGFVGVKQAETKSAEGEVIFEAFPMLSSDEIADCSIKEQLKKVKDHVKKDGVSFNQSLHSLVLKRKISLDSAYKISSDPEELNSFLSQSGI